MMFLDPGSERVVRSAVSQYIEGALRADIEGELVLETGNSTYRFIDGVCFAAADDVFVGAELVGWLLESERSAAVSAWWRREARAVLFLREQEIVVTSPTRALALDGKPARDGFATQQACFVVVRDGPAPANSASDDELHVDVDLESETRPLRPSTADERAPARGEPTERGGAHFGPMRLPTEPLPVSPEVERILGPRTLPLPSLPPPRALYR